MNPRHSATIRCSALLLCLLLGCVAREAGAQTVQPQQKLGPIKTPRQPRSSHPPFAPRSIIRLPVGICRVSILWTL